MRSERPRWTAWTCHACGGSGSTTDKIEHARLCPVTPKAIRAAIAAGNRTEIEREAGKARSRRADDETAHYRGC